VARFHFTPPTRQQQADCGAQQLALGPAFGLTAERSGLQLAPSVAQGLPTA
jgi:hypothetical protein